MISELIDKQDNVEVVRDQIAGILATEIANQQTLATAAGKDPDLWKIRVFSERSNPWELFLNNPQSDPSPFVNVWFDNEQFNRSQSNVVERQKAEAVYNLDCYAFGQSADVSGGGHTPGDEDAALVMQRTVRLVRNIVMAAEHTYLGLRGTVWGRWPASITTFQPALDGQALQQIVAARVALRVEFNEFSPQVPSETLEDVTVDVTRAEDGQILVEADYEYPL